MFWLKSCPRCHGDLYDKTDIYGSYIDCFQCGHSLTAQEDAGLRSENRLGMTFSSTPQEPIKLLADVAV